MPDPLKSAASVFESLPRHLLPGPHAPSLDPTRPPKMQGKNTEEKNDQKRSQPPGKYRSETIRNDHPLPNNSSQKLKLCGQHHEALAICRNPRAGSACQWPGRCISALHGYGARAASSSASVSNLIHIVLATEVASIYLLRLLCASIVGSELDRSF